MWIHLFLIDIAWAGIGAFFVGIGSILTGWAALKTARTKAQEETRLEGKENGKANTNSSNGS